MSFSIEVDGIIYTRQANKDNVFAIKDDNHNNGNCVFCEWGECFPDAATWPAPRKDHDLDRLAKKSDQLSH